MFSSRVGLNNNYSYSTPEGGSPLAPVFSGTNGQQLRNVQMSFPNQVPGYPSIDESYLKYVFWSQG